MLTGLLLSKLGGGECNTFKTQRVLTELIPGSPVKAIRTADAVLSMRSDVVQQYIAVCAKDGTLISKPWIGVEIASVGSMEMLRLLIDSQFIPTYEMANAAAASGRLDVLTYLHEECNVHCSIDGIYMAINGRHDEVARYIRDTATQPDLKIHFDYMILMYLDGFLWGR